jgi:3-phenylpropionate/cinnamic acid dioxygenase small subunit
LIVFAASPALTSTSSLRDLRDAIADFHAVYAAELDRGDVENWPSFFTDDASYRVIARDNHEASLPLCLMSCEGIGMIKDRAYAIKHTEMYAPRYVLHHVSLPRVTGFDSGHATAEANFLIHETLVDEPTRLLMAGRYEDRFRVTPEGALKLAGRTCIFDSVLVANCIVFPV